MLRPFFAVEQQRHAGRHGEHDHDEHPTGSRQLQSAADAVAARAALGQPSAEQKEHDRKQRESSTALKEIRLTPSIGDHDLEVKIKQAKEFLEEGKRVQIVVKFAKRQLNHKELGFDVANKFIAAFGDKIVVSTPPRLDGNRLNCVIASK